MDTSAEAHLKLRDTVVQNYNVLAVVTTASGSLASLFCSYTSVRRLYALLATRLVINLHHTASWF